MALVLITDRTVEDVTRIKTLRDKINDTGWTSLAPAEQAEWNAGKGAYNASDLNRVGSAVAYLAALISSYGYPVTITSPITDWYPGDETSDPDEFNETDGVVFLANVAAIKAAFYGTTATPSAMDNMSPEDANNIERLLLEVEAHLIQMAAAFRRIGELLCGEDQ